ncbi:hypothetical protein Bca4012_082497 [Brassica carinata]|uniref:Uncharacterized protein n=1 Tax=Brassica carinata TaxID=52824 RepID=A0A8X8AMC9_BRACI|nr:hypothetical protein Bca52824_028157 [Brassica carinata]
MLKRLPESFGDLKSLHHLFMQETLVVELPDSFGSLSNLRRVLQMLKKPLSRSYESHSPGTSDEPSFVPNSFSNLLLLEELDARSWKISGKIPDVLEKLYLFLQGPLTFSAQPKRELRGVILAVVVAINNKRKDDYQLPNVTDVHVKRRVRFTGD